MPTKIVDLNGGTVPNPLPSNWRIPGQVAIGAPADFPIDQTQLERALGRAGTINVAAGVTLALTFDLHNGKTIALNGAGAGISFSATTQGDGFAFELWNKTGSDYTIPAFAGGTKDYGINEGLSHTKLKNNGSAIFHVSSRADTLYVRIIGDTGV